MDKGTVDIVRRLNNRFYEINHESFSQSRQSAWPGWGRVMRTFARYAQKQGRGDSSSRIAVLDAASGNLRFERFAVQEHPVLAWEFTCIDSCDDLANGFAASKEDLAGCSVSYRHCDILEELLAGDLQHAFRESRSFDLAVSFGFMHHIPSQELRERFIGALAEAVRPGGVMALSFWRFADEPSLAAKARRSTSRAQERLGLQLEPGDFLLGWNGEDGVVRFCHSFDDGELDSIVASVAREIRLVDRFRSDGRTNDLNEYLVFARNAE